MSLFIHYSCLGVPYNSVWRSQYGLWYVLGFTANTTYQRRTLFSCTCWLVLLCGLKVLLSRRSRLTSLWALAPTPSDGAVLRLRPDFRRVSSLLRCVLASLKESLLYIIIIKQWIIKVKKSTMEEDTKEGHTHTHKTIKHKKFFWFFNFTVSLLLLFAQVWELIK